MEANIAAGTEPDIVIAKSIGTRIALYACLQGMLSAKACIFIGTPIHACSADEIEALINLPASIPVLLIQQASDPVGSYGELITLITPSLNCQAREVAGNNHMYANFARLGQIINSWYKNPNALQK